MKVSYIGPCYDSTGYSFGANTSIAALDAAGVDVAVRSIKLTGQVIPPPERVTQLEKKSTEGTDVIIQHVLPPLMNYQGGVRNIGSFYWETTHFKPSNWQWNLNLMDEVWVSSPEGVEACRLSGVTVPVKLVPLPCDKKLYAQKFVPLDLPAAEGRYVFYSIGDYSERKNTKGLLRAYFQEFSRLDNVVLVMKCYADGKSAAQSLELIRADIQQIKLELRKFNIDYFPPVLLITPYLSTADMYRLHALGHCFVSTERAAGWNIPAFEAIGFGKHTIVNGWGGQTQFIHHEGALLPNVRVTPFQMVPVMGMQHCSYPNLYTCYEQWADPDIFAVRKYMREAYQGGLGTKPVQNEKWLDRWDLPETGRELRSILEGKA